MDHEDEWTEDDYENLADIEDETEEEPSPAAAPMPTLAQMERDGERFAAEVERILQENPDTPTADLLALKEKMVLPMTAYRPTYEEMMALRRADIMHTLRGGKDERYQEEDTDDEPDFDS